jgi:Family of unknown function (DUF5999)
MSSTPGDRAQRKVGGDRSIDAPWNSASQAVPAAPARGRRSCSCPHLPPCPPPQAPDCLAARILAGHPEQGWSLLCNRVVAFEDTGGLLPNASVIEADRMRWQPRRPRDHISGALPDGGPGAREGELCWPGPC